MVVWPLQRALNVSRASKRSSGSANRLAMTVGSSDMVMKKSTIMNSHRITREHAFRQSIGDTYDASGLTSISAELSAEHADISSGGDWQGARRYMSGLYSETTKPEDEAHTEVRDPIFASLIALCYI